MSLQPLFHPRSVAVIGASRDERSISEASVRNLMESFSGLLYLVNPHANRIGALASHPSILHTPDPVDLAFAIPEICELDLNPVALFQSRDLLRVLDARTFVACPNAAQPQRNRRADGR